MEIFTLNALTFSNPVGILGAAAVTAGIGAVIGSVNEWEKRDDYQRYGETLGGTLKPETDSQGNRRLRFQPVGISSPVELSEHAQAPVAPEGALPTPLWAQAQPVVPM